MPTLTRLVAIQVVLDGSGRVRSIAALVFSIVITERGGAQRQLDFDSPEVSIGRLEDNEICENSYCCLPEYTKCNTYFGGCCEGMCCLGGFCTVATVVQDPAQRQLWICAGGARLGEREVFTF